MAIGIYSLFICEDCSHLNTVILFVFHFAVNICLYEVAEMLVLKGQTVGFKTEMKLFEAVVTKV